MKPVDQAILSEPHGDCLRACVASILELDADQVPNFADVENWEQALADFLAGYGLQPIPLAVATCRSEGWRPLGYHCIVGPGAREVYHAVVGYRGEAVHDPHPSRLGLKADEYWILFAAALDRGGDHPSSNVAAGWLPRILGGQDGR